VVPHPTYERVQHVQAYVKPIQDVALSHGIVEGSGVGDEVECDVIVFAIPE